LHTRQSNKPGITPGLLLESSLGRRPHDRHQLFFLRRLDFFHLLNLASVVEPFLSRPQSCVTSVIFVNFSFWRMLADNEVPPPPLAFQEEIKMRFVRRVLSARTVILLMTQAIVGLPAAAQQEVNPDHFDQKPAVSQGQKPPRTRQSASQTKLKGVKHPSAAPRPKMLQRPSR
jgi:hypothetical protein